MTNPNHTDTTRSGDLVERLRAFDYNVDIAMFYDKDPECVSEAADRIEALEAENERLREALKGVTESYNHWTAVICARAALGEKQ